MYLVKFEHLTKEHIFYQLKWQRTLDAPKKIYLMFLESQIIQGVYLCTENIMNIKKNISHIPVILYIRKNYKINNHIRQEGKAYTATKRLEEKKSMMDKRFMARIYKITNLPKCQEYNKLFHPEVNSYVKMLTFCC